MTNGHRAGKWRFLGMGQYGTRRYFVREIGHVSVAYHEPLTPNNPSTRPWHLVCWGRNFDTPEEALEHAIKSWNEPEPAWSNEYARQEDLMCGPGRFEQP